jgi:hypothetical protein
VAIGTKILDLSVIKHLFNGPQMNGKQNVFEEVNKIDSNLDFYK